MCFRYQAISTGSQKPTRVLHYLHTSYKDIINKSLVMGRSQEVFLCPDNVRHVLNLVWILH